MNSHNRILPPLVSILATGLFCLTGLEVKAESLSLADFVTRSIEKSDTVTSQNFTYKKSEAAVREKRAAYLPTLNASVGATQSPVTGSSTTASGLFSSNANYLTSQVNINANLFRGFQDSKAIEQAVFQKDQNNYLLKNIRYTQVSDAVAAFFAVIEDESDVANYKLELETNRAILKDTQARAKSGIVRQTEVINLQTTIANSEIDLATAEATLATDRIKAARLLGDQNQQVQLAYGSPTCSASSVVDIASKASAIDLPDFQATRANTEAQKRALDASKGQNLPQLDFSSSYILTDSRSISSAGNYTLGLTLTIPFPFAQTAAAQIEENSVAYSLAQFQETTKKRDLEQTRSTLVQQVQADVAQFEKLKTAVKISERNVVALKQDHKSGLSTYSDVLSGSSTYQATLRRKDRAALQLDLDCYKAIVWSAGEFQTLNSKRAQASEERQSANISSSPVQEVSKGEAQ